MSSNPRSSKKMKLLSPTEVERLRKAVKQGAPRWGKALGGVTANQPPGIPALGERLEATAGMTASAAAVVALAHGVEGGAPTANEAEEGASTAHGVEEASASRGVGALTVHEAEERGFAAHEVEEAPIDHGVETPSAQETEGSGSTFTLGPLAKLAEWASRHVVEDDITALLALHPMDVLREVSISLLKAAPALLATRLTFQDIGLDYEKLEADLKAKISELEAVAHDRDAAVAQSEALQGALRVLDEALQDGVSRRCELEDLRLRFSSLVSEKQRVEEELAEATSRSAKVAAQLAEVEASIPRARATTVKAFKAYEGQAEELEEYFDMGYARCEELVKLKYPELDLSCLAEEVAETSVLAEVRADEVVGAPIPVEAQAKDLP